MTNHHTDWNAVLRSWDQQQSGYLRQRERRFTAALDALVDLDGPLHILDLGCGPGSFSARVLQRFPTATVIALDTDPVLLAVGQGALGDGGGRLKWVDADLRSPHWLSLIGDRPFDAVISSTALHWLGPAQLAAVYSSLATVIRPGGRFINADSIGYNADQPTLTALAQTGTDRHSKRSFETDETPDWDTWWNTAGTIDELTAAHTERQSRAIQRTPDPQDHIPLTRLSSLTLHTALLQEAGFAEVGTIWQDHDDRILLAVPQSRPA